MTVAENHSQFTAPNRLVAVLLGGGIESTLLVRRYLDSNYQVLPVHIHCGLIWDDVETEYCRRFCRNLARPNLLPLVETRLSLRETLGDHWAVTGRGVPVAGAPSAQLEIPLRNLTLLGFAWNSIAAQSCAALALGTTRENDYRDGSRRYFDRCADVLSIEAGREVTILTPVIHWTKTQVIRESDRATLAASFSCVNPRGDRHCGQCIKCDKRRQSFVAAQVPDPTEYYQSTTGHPA